MKRSTWVTITMVVVLTGIVITFLLFSLDSLVTKAVEKYGSEALQAEVTLDRTKISAASGKGTLSGLRVGNPKGFETDTAFELGEISIELNVGSITKRTVLIKEIIITAPVITYELGINGSNLDALQKNVSGQTGGGSVKSSDADGPAKANQSGKKLIIDLLIIKDGKINVSAVGLQGKKMSVNLPKVRLTGIGRDEGGASPSEVVGKLIDAINAAASGAVGSLDLGKVLGNVEGMAKGAKEALKKDGPELIEKKAEEIGDALKGLLGK